MSPPAASTPPPRSVRLHELAGVPLDDETRAALDAASAASLGPRHWIARKAQEVREIAALARIAPRERLRLLGVDMTETVQLLLELRCPVGCMAPGAGELVVFDRVRLAIRYPQEVLTSDLPGTSFVKIFEPRFVFHPNAHSITGIACLGQTLPRNVRLREIVLMTYSALAMQSVTLDERDAAGVLNAAAARWWRDHRDRMPLTRTALLEDRPL